MQKIKKTIAILLVVTLLSGTGLFNVSSIVAFAEETTVKKQFDDDTSYFSVDDSNPYNPVYYDEYKRLVDFNEFLSGLADANSGYSVGSLPSSYDARKDNLTTRVKNQGDYGTCWAHASLACLESNAVKKGYMSVNDADFSESHLAWFEKNPDDSLSDTSADDGKNNKVTYVGDKTGALESGAWGHDAIVTLSRQGGIALEKNYPYDKVEPTSKPLYSDESRFDSGSGLYADTMVYFPHEGYNDGLDILKEVKSWIINHGSATIDYYHNSSFFNEKTKAYYFPPVIEENSNHDVQIIGWDDNYSRKNFNIESRPKKDGAWLVKNSWGTDWGDKGFFWLSYESLHVGFNGYEIEKIEKGTNKPYTYNGIGAHKNYVVFNASDFLTANVFETKDNEALSKISFYTAQPDLNVDIRVYKLEKEYKAPMSGDQVYSASGSYHNIGFHTINLKNKVTLGKNQLFSVVVGYTTAAGKILVHTETNYRADNTRFKSNKGESWFGHNGDWLDTSELGMGNCYINAITETTTGAGSAVPSDSNGRISVLPSNISIDEGASKSICYACSPIDGKFYLNFDFDNKIIDAKVENNIGGINYAFINGIGKLTVKGIKAGTTDVKIELIDSATKKILDAKNIKVTVKGKSTPTSPTTDYSKVKVTIRKPETTSIRYGMDSLYLHATAENLPAGAKLIWSVDGDSIKIYNEPCRVSGHPSGCSCIFADAVGSGDSTVYCKVCDASGNPLKYNGKEIQSSIKITGISNLFLILFSWILVFFGKTYNS